MPRDLFLSSDSIKRADDLDFSTQVETGLSNLRFPHAVEEGIRGLRTIAFGHPDATEWQPEAALTPDPLPITVTPQPQIPPLTTPAVPMPEPSRADTTPAATGVSDAQQLAPNVQTGSDGGAPFPSPSVPSVPAAGGAPPPPATPSGTADPTSRAYQAARSAGLDDEAARIVTAVTATEGGMQGAAGDQGQSVGGLQFHERGELPGFARWLGTTVADARTKAQDIGLSAAYAAQGYLGRAIEEGRKLGLSGAELATYVQRTGQRSESPERTGANYERLYGQGAAAPMPEQASTAAPMPAQPAVSVQPGTLAPERPTQFAQGLSYAEAIAACGLAGVAWFLARTGRTPQTVAEVRDAARISQDWDPGSGMHGAEATAHLLRTQGVAAHVEPGVDWTKVRRDVSSGNPVMFDTDAGSSGHYYTVQDARQRSDGQWEYDLGTSATDLRASKGQRWFTADAVEGLGFGRPYRTIYTDNPQTPAPSPAAGRSPAASAGDPLRATLSEPGQGDTMQRTSLSEPAPMPEDASDGDRNFTGTMPDREGTRPEPIRNVVPFDPATNTTGPLPNTPAEYMSYRQPLGTPTMGPDTATGDQPASPATYGDAGDAQQVPMSQPTYGPPLSEAGPEQPKGALERLYDTAGNAIGWVRAQADQIGQNMAGNRQAVEDANAGQGYVPGQPEPAGPFEIAGQAVVNQLNAPGPADISHRMREIEQQAATDQGRTDTRALLGDAVNEPTWRGQHPDLAAEYDDLRDQFTLLIGGSVSPVEGIRAATGAVRGIGQVAEEGRRPPYPDTRSPAAPLPERVPVTYPTREEVARADARMAAEGSTSLGMATGPAPAPEVRIPRAGYATDISPGAEQMAREASEANAPREVVRRADVGQKAQDILGAHPEDVQRWQQEALAEAPDARAVRGEALRQAEYIDAENADRAIERLRAAQRKAKDVGSLSEDDKFDAADALLEAAEAARAFGISAQASTAEGRAAARSLGQRRNAITARQAFATAERARQVAQDAAFAAQEALRASRTGQVTEAGATRLRILRDKLLEAERHGLMGDGAGGRLVAMEAPASTTAAARVGPGARPGVGLGTRVATDVGNAALGSIVGGTAGYVAPADTDEQRRANMRTGALIGAVGYPLVGRMLPRRGGTRAAFGPAPTPEIPNRAIAVGSDPSKRYEFRYRVADLGDLVPSNLPSGAPNPAFPRELQPRARERVASQLQIDQIARGLEPDALLTDVGRLDSGPMIVGSDRIVESGNGRVLALQRAAEQYPERYQAYVDSMRRDIGQYGLSETDLAGKDRPVLVRERVSNVDRAAFAQEANNAGLLRMSSVEQAGQDAANLSDATVTGLQVGENDTIASALRRTENRDLVRQWVGALPENERAGVLDASGDLSAQGYERLTNALLMRTYGQGAGERLARTFIESADPTVRNVQTALMASLPDVARSEALIRSGQREAGLSIAEDVAAATEMLARLRRDGIKPAEYLDQAAMFDRELTPMQESILSFLDQNTRRPSAIREALKEYASRVENAADPNQGAMFGEQLAAPTREDLWRGATAGSGVDVPNAVSPLEAGAAARGAPADGAGLASRGAESVAPAIDIPPAPELPAVRPAAPVTAPRPGPIPENAAPRGGPEGALRPAVVPDPSMPAGPAIAAPAGGPESGLRSAVVADRSVPAGPAIGAPSGGPEGTLSRRYAADRSVPAGPVAGDIAATGGPEGTLTLASGRTIKDVAAQIDDVLANPTRPGASARLQELHADLQEISTQGFKKSSEIRRRLQRNGLLRAGLASKDQNVDALVTALARTDPNKPEEMRAVLNIISKPRLIDRLLEYQYVNMLSSPITQAVNITSNVAQIAGRLLLQNPLEFVYSGGRSTGVGAAFGGAGRGFREGLGEAGQIMRTGTSTADVERGLALGDYSHVNRETLPALFHVISTRPLAAMDALLGHVAYASAAEQFAQRKADQLLRTGSQAVKGMDRQTAKQYVLSNIWDHPDIIEKAGKIEDYTLLRGRGTSDFERNMRGLISSRVPEGAGFERQAGAFLANQIMPFTNVPINAAKQGIERSVGVPVNVVRAARAYARGDVERGAELAAKATIGAAAIGTATVLAMGGNITGEGPSDSGQRAIWELTHRRNSFKVPGTDTWISWEGSPMAIPFGMVAGAAEGIEEAQKRSARKGQTDAVDVVGSAAYKGAQGAVQGFASQSFVKALGDQYQLITGDQTGLGSVAASMAGTASRFVPASSMLNFMARVADHVERDAGKPQAASDIPENVGARIAARLPGIPGVVKGPRERLDPRLNAYGELQGRIPPAPYYRGAGDMAGDPITRTLESSGVGAIEVPPEVPAGVTTGVPIPLETPAERRAFQEASGQTWRRLMEINNVGAGGWAPQAIEHLRTQARQAGVAAALREIPPAERQRRVQAALRRKSS